MTVTLSPSMAEPLIRNSRRLLQSETLTGTTALDSIIVPVIGCARMRIVAKSTTSAPTISFAFTAPDGKTAYTVNKPTSLVLVAGTENFKDIDPHFGEAALKITVTPDITGVLDYLDINFG